MSTAPLWDYWCPAEGTHIISPQELWVGIVSVDDEGVGWPTLVVAVIPPLPTEPPTQAEGFARLMRDALADVNWREKDGVAAWAWAHGMHVVWPHQMPSLAALSPKEGDQ